MKTNLHRFASWGAVSVLALFLFDIAWVSTASATSQWARKNGMECNSCHTVFPRLNSIGEDYLRNGYQMASSHESEGQVSWLDKVDNLFGFRLNMTPVQVETNAFAEDSADVNDKSSRITLGSPIWLQMFVAGSIYKDISFFSELEHASGSFKFNWFYFNVTNIGGSQALNFQVGNISPLEFASYPNRLPQLPNLKGEVFLIKSSPDLAKPTTGSGGEESIDMSSARPGIQYFGYNNWVLAYAGVTPGTKATDVNQFLHYWGGLVFRLPENVLRGFEGSTATIHAYAGKDTKFTGFTASPDTAQVENAFTRISPQLNIRYRGRVDIQAAYVLAKDDNRSFVASGATEFKYNGIAIEAGYMPNPKWHLALHYDKYTSDNENTSGARVGKPILEFQRVVPAVTYVINQNIRTSVYYEKDLSDETGRPELIDKLYVNVRTMF
jgi:hypothetical protein